jgi:heptosyltransferase-1
MRILLVKTSSLGDVVHNLPVASDIRRHLPQAEIDWVVEDFCADVPRLHPAVREVIPVQLRRWRRTLLQGETWRALSALRARLRKRSYDVVIDTQGLLKSALIARLAPGTRIGLDWASSREPLRAFYHRTVHVPWGQHAVERNRQLAARALDYNLVGCAPSYGILAPPLTAGAAAWGDCRHYAALLHPTSAADKLWPEHQWVKLGDHLNRRGLACVLPWGSDVERERSERLAKLIKTAFVPSRLSLREAAGLLGHADVVFGVDTGLSHLAAALGTPTVGIYVATDPAATGLHGASRACNAGGRGQPPSLNDVIGAERQVMQAPVPPA